MKQVYLLLITVFCLGIILNAQTPYSFINIASDSQVSTKGISANNVWLGAQIGYKLSGPGDFSDNLLVSGRLLYNIDINTTKFKLPVMGDISALRDAASTGNIDSLTAKAQDLLLSTQGINVGLYPFYEAYKNTYFSFTIHGSLTYKLNAFKVDDETINLDQGRFSAGMETSIGKRNDDKYPLTISVTPVLTFFSKNRYKMIFGEEKSSLLSLEITGIVPIGSGFGLLIESVIAKDNAPAVRTGIVFSK